MPGVEVVAGFGLPVIPGPFQSIVLPPLSPVKVQMGVMQFILLLLLADTVGAVVLLVIVTVAVLLHPVDPSVAVTVYVPGVFIIAGLPALLKEPPFQSRLVPALVALKVVKIVVQVRLLNVRPLITGGVVLLSIATVPVPVHPRASVAVAE